METLTEYLQTIGNSVVAFKTGSIVKVHVHTMTPDRVLAFCQRYGEFLTVKIENMSLQHNNLSPAEAPAPERRPFGVVTVACGEGIQALFRQLGADEVINGGQSMNPSAGDFLAAFDRRMPIPSLCCRTMAMCCWLPGRRPGCTPAQMCG